MLISCDFGHLRDLIDRYSVPGDSPVVHYAFIIWVNEICSYTSFPESIEMIFGRCDETKPYKKEDISHHVILKQPQSISVSPVST